MKNIDIDKIVVSNKVSFGKKGFKYFIGYKDGKKFDFYAYVCQKCVYKEETLMKLNICLFFKKRWWIVRKMEYHFGKCQQ